MVNGAKPGTGADLWEQLHYGQAKSITILFYFWNHVFSKQIFDLVQFTVLPFEPWFKLTYTEKFSLNYCTYSNISLHVVARVVSCPNERRKWDFLNFFQKLSANMNFAKFSLFVFHAVASENFFLFLFSNHFHMSHVWLTPFFPAKLPPLLPYARKKNLYNCLSIVMTSLCRRGIRMLCFFFSYLLLQLRNGDGASALRLVHSYNSLRTSLSTRPLVRYKTACL